jgi:hypothetical protein
MAPFRTRNQCSKEPAKTVPTQTEVKVCDIPENFPKKCEKMIGQTYPAIVHVDRRGKTWYNILKDLVFGEQPEFHVVTRTVDTDNKVVSFQNRKYIKLHEKYCN